MDDETVAARITEECSHGDYESAHSDADQHLIELLTHLGYTKTVAAWEAVGKWYA